MKPLQTTDPNPRSCETCRWWQPNHDDSPARGQCRIKSPQPPGLGTASRAAWPITAWDEWCGEWTDPLPTEDGGTTKN